MSITLDKVTKQYNDVVLFQDVDYTFKSDTKYAIKGHNGSGKSTLLQIISSFLIPDKGTLTYRMGATALKPEEIYKHVSIAAPFSALFLEMTLKEAIDFHFQFKELTHFTNTHELIDFLQFSTSQHKTLQNFSSGMLQKVKLALAVFSKTSILLLDEPCMNFDEANKGWYIDLMHKYTNDRLVVIASNDPFETSFCEHSIRILDYK